MEHKGNIIAIRKEDVSLANEAFAELMSKTENILNEESKANPLKFKSISPSKLEQVSLDTLKIACANTPFDPKNVELVSGQNFPDIIAETYYGVEVKSTNKDHWKSTGSSIVESTRSKYVENIYMLFGKLGGNPPEFRCRPYQDVLCDVAVTHSPRYLINMELDKGQSIFAKMGTTYDELRVSQDSISRVRAYYRDKAKRENKEEMPWWLTQDEDGNTKRFNVRLWNAVPMSERKELLAKCLILFPETLNPKRGYKKYNQATLWLCSYCQVVMPNIRDVFTAGGRIVSVDGIELEKSVSQIFNTVVECSDVVRRLLTDIDNDMLSLIEEFNPKLLRGGVVYENWLELCASIGKKYGVPILDWIERKPCLH